MEPVKEGHRSGSYDDKMNTLQGDQTYPSNEIIKTKGAQPSLVLTPMTANGGDYYSGILSIVDPLFSNFTITSSLSGVEFGFGLELGSKYYISSSSAIPNNITSFNLFIRIQDLYNGTIDQTFTINVQNLWTDFGSIALNAYIDEIDRFGQIMQQAGAAMLTGGTFSDDDFRNQAHNFAVGQKTDLVFQKALYGAADLLDTSSATVVGTRPYRQTLDRFTQLGMAPILLRLRQAATFAGTPTSVRSLIMKTFDNLEDLGIGVEKVITQAATQLANFLIDGTYTFNYILSQTPSQPNGATGTGTATITSEIDKYTNGLAQKLINQTITTPFSMNILQTLDISYNSILIDTYGTSNTGDYTIEGNTLTITSYGYSNDKIFFGEFITDVVKIIKTDIGYIVQHNKINPDNSIGPLIDVVYYVRQKTISDELAAVIDIAFQELDPDRDGTISREDATKLLARLGILKDGLPTNGKYWTADAIKALDLRPYDG